MNTTRFGCRTRPLLALAIVGIAAVALIASAPKAEAALEAEADSVVLLAGPVTLTAGTATNILAVSPNKTLKLQPGQNVGVHFNQAGNGASTANQIAYFQYKTDVSPWSTTLVAATKALAGTAQVSSSVTLTNGLDFPSTATELRLSYFTNASTVTAYTTNLTASTWKVIR